MVDLRDPNVNPQYLQFTRAMDREAWAKRGDSKERVSLIAVD
jgi:hypothetical protein